MHRNMEEKKSMESELKLRRLDEIKEGEIFSKYTVIKEGKRRGNSRFFECKCECGRMANVRGYDLLRGKATRCQSCAAVARNTKHGQNKYGKITYEYRLWQNLKQKNKLCP